MFGIEEGVAPRGSGRQFKSENGRAVLAVYSQRNEGDTPATYVRKNFKVPRERTDYERVTPTFFAISAVHAREIYYSRCNFSGLSGDGAIHCFDLRYPARDKRAWDPIVTRMSLSLRPLVPIAINSSSHNTPSTRIPLLDQSLLEPQPPPDCAFKEPLSNPPTAEETRTKLDYEQQCYRHSEMIVRARLQQRPSYTWEIHRASGTPCQRIEGRIRLLGRGEPGRPKSARRVASL
jgi:hypothetical protein